MSSHWPVKPLIDLCEFRNGLWKGKKPPYVHVGVIRNTNFKADGSLDDSDIAFLDVEEKLFTKRQLQFGDIILEKSGGGPKQPVGRVIIFNKAEGLYSFSNFTSIMRVLDPLVLDFQYLHRLLYWYYVSNVTEKMQRRSTGIRNLNFADYKQLPVPLPPLPEQKRIVAILDEAFAGISTAVVNTEKNLANARELWVDVLKLACSGALTKDWRTKNSKIEPARDLLLRTIARRREQRKTFDRHKGPKSAIAASMTIIPDTWVWASPEELSTHIVDCPHSTPKWSNAGLACIRTTNFRPGYLDLNSVKCVSESTYTERIKRLEPAAGDVLYSREGGILGIACIFPVGLKACLGQRMMLFRLDNYAVHPRYFVCVLNSPLILAIVNQLTAGAAAPHINIQDIRTFPIPLPPIAEQKQIITLLDTLWTSLQRLERIQLQKLDSLVELKQSILQKAFSGELTANLDNALKEARL